MHTNLRKRSPPLRGELLVDFLDFRSPDYVLNTPYDDKKEKKDEKVLDKALQRMFHPVSEIGDRHHDKTGEKKVDAGLFCNAPALHLPYERDHGKSGPEYS
jgi:hypothetical protein